METVHPVFGPLDLDDLDRLTARKTIRFAGRDTAVTISFENEEIPEAYSRTYAALTEKLEGGSEILMAILRYQREHYHDSGHTEDFPCFETPADVLAHTTLFEIALRDGFPGIAAPSGETPGRCAVLLFSAEWVSDDYGVLSAALVNEQAVLIRDQALIE